MKEIFWVEHGYNHEIIGGAVYLNEKQANEEMMWEENRSGRYDGAYFIGSTKLPFVGKHISQVEVYHGFDYAFAANGPFINDIIKKSSLYPSVTLAKQSELWLEYKHKAEAEPDKYNFHDNTIASKDHEDSDFMYGDAMEGKFNMQVKMYKVIR